MQFYIYSILFLLEKNSKDDAFDKYPFDKKKKWINWKPRVKMRVYSIVGFVKICRNMFWEAFWEQLQNTKHLYFHNYVHI